MFFSELLAVSCRLAGLRRPDAAFLSLRAAKTRLRSVGTRSSQDWAR